MKVWFCRLALMAALASQLAPAWSMDPQVAGNPTGGQAGLEQNYINQTGMYQGGGHTNKELDQTYGGLAKSTIAPSAGSGTDDKITTVHISQSPTQELKQTELKAGVGPENPNRTLHQSFGSFGGMQRALGPFGTGSGNRESGQDKNDWNIFGFNGNGANSGNPLPGANGKSFDELSANKKNREQGSSYPQAGQNNRGQQNDSTSSSSSQTNTSSANANPDTINSNSSTMSQSEPHAYPPMNVSNSKIASQIGKDFAKSAGAAGPSGSKLLSNAEAGVQAGGAALLANLLKNAPGANAGQAKANQNAQKEQGADNLAAMERYHAAAAIDWVRSFMVNFTVDGGNKWNQVRDKLFVPIGILLLLPGAMLCQVKSIASQGMAVLGEINPFEGIFRSIVGIFLIPATYLIVNYGIDVANSITFTISKQYRQQFGSDMYADAFCGHIRAFPIREPDENPGMITDQKTQMFNYFGNTPLARLEGKTLAIKYEDPCSGLYIVPPDRNNDNVPYMVNEQRLAYNQANAAFSMAWVILCAVQQGYLYYLYFVGPVVAALWVFPSKQLRDAFPSWIEGVVTLCFWSLFWNVTILLMACFRGVDDTGTIMFTALNFLAIGSAKFAFDFTGLVKDAGREAMSMAQKAAQASAAASKKSEGGGGGGGGGGGNSGGKSCGGGSNSESGSGTRSGGSAGDSEGGPNAPDLTSVGAHNSFQSPQFVSGTGGFAAPNSGHSLSGKPDNVPHPPSSATSRSLALDSNLKDLGGLAGLRLMAKGDFANAQDNMQVPGGVDIADDATKSPAENRSGQVSAESGPIEKIAMKDSGVTVPPSYGNAGKFEAGTEGHGLKPNHTELAKNLGDNHKHSSSENHGSHGSFVAGQSKGFQVAAIDSPVSTPVSGSTQPKVSSPVPLSRNSVDADSSQLASLDWMTGPTQQFSRASLDLDPSTISADDAALQAATAAANAAALSAYNVTPSQITPPAIDSTPIFAKASVDESQPAADYSSLASSTFASNSFASNIESSAASLTSDDYNYPSLSIDASTNSRGSLEQTYSSTYEQTYSSVYERASAEASNRAQQVQYEQKQQSEQRQLEAREKHIEIPNTKPSPNFRPVQSAAKSTESHSSNFLSSVVNAATKSNSPPPSAAPANTWQKMPQPAGAPETRTQAGDWSNHLAQEVIKRRSRAVQKQSDSEKAADLKSLRDMCSRDQ